MKTIFLVGVALAMAVSNAALAAGEPNVGMGMGGAMMGGTNPPSLPGCCCSRQMQKTEAAAAEPSLDQLLSNVKDAKGDQLLDALAAVLNKLIDERKAAPPGSAPVTPPQGHQH